MTPDLLVILVDPDQARSVASQTALARGGCRVQAVADPAMALAAAESAAAARGGTTVILAADLSPAEGGWEWARRLRANPATAKIPILLLAEPGDAAARANALARGASGVLRRPFDHEALVVALRETRPPGGAAGSEIESFLEHMDDRARQENPLVQLVTDPWTGLYNEAYTALKLADEFKKARRFQMPLTCVVLGIDQAEALAGNPTELRAGVNEVAGLLLCESRDIDHLARPGQAEFLALLTGTPTSGGVTMAERILSSLEARGIPAPEEAGVLTASAGVATFPGPGIDSGDELLARAREALARAQAAGGNRVQALAGGPAASRD